MISIKRLAGALCLALSFSSFSNAQTTQTGVTTNTYSISDDSYANVPLQFNFPYYGQTFNNSWMFSNGIVSFQNPQTSGLAWQNLSVQPLSSTMGSQFNYSIYALWTDLINLSGTFKTEGNNTFQRYSWLGISPYYDSSRLNTFSVEIRPDGKIITNYVGLSANYGTVGITGNTSSGEYEQINYFTGPISTGSISNWERYTSNPCSTNVLSSPSCPGYFEELAKLNPPSTNTLATVDSTPTTTTTITNDPMVPVVVTYTAPVSSTQTAVSTFSTPTTATTQTTSERSVSTPSVSMLLGIIRAEQSRLSGVEGAAVSQANEAATQAASQASSIAESVAATAATNSTSEQVKNVGSSASQSSSSSTNIFGGGTSSLSGIGLRGPSISSNSLDSQNIETVNISSIDFTGKSPIKDYLDEKSTTQQEQSQTSQRQPEVKRNVLDNQAAGEVTIASIARQPSGFDLYMSLSLKDTTFYAPKEIYKGQKTVDNVRLLRGLTGGSDRLHQQLVDQQYNLGR